MPESEPGRGKEGVTFGGAARESCPARMADAAWQRRAGVQRRFMPSSPCGYRTLRCNPCRVPLKSEERAGAPRAQKSANAGSAASCDGKRRRPEQLYRARRR